MMPATIPASGVPESGEPESGVPESGGVEVELHPASAAATNNAKAILTFMNSSRGFDFKPPAQRAFPRSTGPRKAVPRSVYKPHFYVGKAQCGSRCTISRRF